jgi:hypothetical protein
MYEIGSEHFGRPAPLRSFINVAMIVVGCVVASGIWVPVVVKSFNFRPLVLLLLWLTAGPLIGVGLLSLIKMPVRGFVIGIVGQLLLTWLLLHMDRFWASW